MQTSYLVCCLLIIIMHIGFVQNESTPAPTSQRKRMKNKGIRKVTGNRKSGRQRKAQPSSLPAPATRIPLIITDDPFMNVFDSIIGLGEPESSYNVLPGKKGHCSANGMIMYDKAVWSPKPCITCLCSNGKAICDETICPALNCPKTVTQEGECCPVCTDIEPNDPSEAVLVPVPHFQEEMEEQLRREEEERQVEEEAIQKKEEQEKKRKERKRQKEEKERKELEARRKEEEDLERTNEENKRKAYEEEELQLEEEERKKREEEEQRREEDNRKKEEETRREKEKQRALEREEDDEEEEPDEEDILRGDVFRNPSGVGHPDEFPPMPPPLPLGCFISDVTVSCTNAKLRTIPPISNPDIKSLDLQGNSITSIPNEAFNGIPNVERINLSKNNLTSLSIGPQAFKTIKNLKRLYLDGNALVHIPPELPSTLDELKLSENNIQTIDDDSLQA